MHPFHRTELLVGGEGFERLTQASVCVIGLGGVGSYAAEALVRSGIGHVTVVDFDDICLTNLNRQLPALRSTVGRGKAELVGERAADINPKCDVRVLPMFYGPDTADGILDRPYDVVLDCIDNMTAKVHLLTTCVRRGQPVVAAMGAGGRMDPTRVRVTDISETRIDPFARIVRDLLRKEGITEGVSAVWTDESPNDLDAAAEAGFRCICPGRADSPHSCDRRLQVQGSVAWMPPVFGMTMAAHAVHAILGRELAVPRDVRSRRQRPSTDKPSAERKRELLAAAGFAKLTARSRQDLPG